MTGDVADETTEQPTPNDSVSSPGRLSSAYYWLQGTLLAPFGLLREYIVPLLSFLIVFGGLAYFLLY